MACRGELSSQVPRGHPRKARMTLRAMSSLFDLYVASATVARLCKPVSVCTHPIVDRLFDTED